MEPNKQFNRILELVKLELSKKLNKPEIQDMDEIPLSVAEELLLAEDVIIYSKFKEQLCTAWAIAKYMTLILQEKDLNEKVKQNLLQDLPKNINYFFLNNLSCQVQLTKEYIEGAKQEALCIKYYLDEDEHLHYKLMCTNCVWGWDITKLQLLALLQNNIIIPENIPNEISLNYSNTSKKISILGKILRKLHIIK